MVLSFLATATVTSGTTGVGITPADYLIAACLAACATAIPSLLAWHSARKGRTESHDDVTSQNTHLNNQFEKIGIHFDRIELRFDALEDKTERHLDWHRAEAEKDLPELMKEHISVNNPGADPGTRNS